MRALGQELANAERHAITRLTPTGTSRGAPKSGGSAARLLRGVSVCFRPLPSAHCPRRPLPGRRLGPDAPQAGRLNQDRSAMQAFGKRLESFSHSGLAATNYRTARSPRCSPRKHPQSITGTTQARSRTRQFSLRRYLLLVAAVVHCNSRQTFGHYLCINCFSSGQQIPLRQDAPLDNTYAL